MKKLITILFLFNVAFCQLVPRAYLRVKTDGTGFELADSTGFQTTLSIGTEITTAPLNVTNFSTTFPSPQTGTIAHFVSNAVTNGRLSFDTYNSSFTGSIFQGRKADSVAAYPTAAKTDMILVAVGGDGYGTTGFHNISLGSFAVRSEGTMTDVSAPTYLSFHTTPTGSITSAERMRILSTGALKLPYYGVGTFTGTPAYTLQVDASGNVIEGSMGGSASWGSITGTLSSQTDLQTALDGKQASGSYALQATTVNGHALSGNVTVTATDLSLGNVTNTSDANKPVSTAQQTALDLKANLVSPSFTTPNIGSATGSVSGNAGTATTLATPRLINGSSFNGSADITVTSDLLAYAALGSPILAETVSQSLAYSNVSTNMVDGQIKFEAVYLTKAATLTGIKVYVRVLGNYTGDNNNRVGLYSYSGGNLTLVASSANNASLWTSGANAIQTIPFSGTYAASAGLYYVGFLYNQSAQTTAPALASGVALNNLVMGSTALGFTNSAKLHGTANGTDLTTPIAMSAITSSVIPSWVALY